MSQPSPRSTATTLGPIGSRSLPCVGTSGAPVSDLTGREIADLAAAWLFERRWSVVAVEVEWPAHGRRVDVLAARPRDRVGVIEVKISRSDLLRDVAAGKALGYRAHCDALWWAVPASLVPCALAAVDGSMGVLSVEAGAAVCVRAAPRMAGDADRARCAAAVERIAKSLSAREVDRLCGGCRVPERRGKPEAVEAVVLDERALEIESALARRRAAAAMVRAARREHSR
jgi:hypothetical protein